MQGHGMFTRIIHSSQTHILNRLCGKLPQKKRKRKRRRRCRAIGMFTNSHPEQTVWKVASKKEKKKKEKKMQGHRYVHKLTS